MATLGEEKLKKIQIGMVAFLEGAKEGGKMSAEVYDATEVLSSLGDFENFKRSMIAKRMAMEGLEGTGNNQMNQIGVVDMGNNTVLENLKLLKEAGENLEGWEKIVDNPGAGAWTKLQANGDSIIRCNLDVDMHPALLLESFINNTPLSCEFWPEIKAKTVEKDWGPNDFVVTYDLDLAWAVRYIMGFPNRMTVHVVS